MTDFGTTGSFDEDGNWVEDSEFLTTFADPTDSSSVGDGSVVFNDASDSGRTTSADRPSPWTPAAIDALIHDGAGIASAWYTAQSGKPVVLPGTDPKYTNQQLAALAGGRLAQTPAGSALLYPQASLGAQSNSTLILLAAAVLVLVLVLKN